MLIVTERAKEELRAVLADSVDEPGMSLRLVASAPGQFGLVPDAEKEGDHVVEHEGVKVLLIDEELSAHLESVTIDCREMPEGPKLVIAKKT
ncbi:MAG: hypothetical protein HY726_10860 [Candidatus Rokubacteria bacterium]|nr:hypothetical protein [Candidatus Rokubacteria bacterium]